jgi:hypothetical protein
MPSTRPRPSPPSRRWGLRRCPSFQTISFRKKIAATNGSDSSWRRSALPVLAAYDFGAALEIPPNAVLKGEPAVLTHLVPVIPRFHLIPLRSPGHLTPSMPSMRQRKPISAVRCSMSRAGANTSAPWKATPERAPLAPPVILGRRVQAFEARPRRLDSPRNQRLGFKRDPNLENRPAHGGR